LKCTNARAAAEGAGGKEYKDFVPFDLKEIYKMNAVLFLNALSPKPQLEYWFLGQDQHSIFGNDVFC
jgi:hypothetical protein